MAKTVKVSKFKLDSNLGYLIQQITKEPTQEVVGHLLGLASYMAEEKVKKSKARSLNTDLVLFYKDTSIPFKINVWCFRLNQYDHVVPVTVTVSFPKETASVDVTELLNVITEVGLGLSVEPDAANQIPPFEKPTLKSPAFLKELRKEHESRK